ASTLIRRGFGPRLVRRQTSHCRPSADGDYTVSYTVISRQRTDAGDSTRSGVSSWFAHSAIAASYARTRSQPRSRRMKTPCVVRIPAWQWTITSLAGCTPASLSRARSSGADLTILRSSSVTNFCANRWSALGIWPTRLLLKSFVAPDHSPSGLTSRIWVAGSSSLDFTSSRRPITDSSGRGVNRPGSGAVSLKVTGRPSLIQRYHTPLRTLASVWP